MAIVLVLASGSRDLTAKKTVKRHLPSNCGESGFASFLRFLCFGVLTVPFYTIPPTLPMGFGIPLSGWLLLTRRGLLANLAWN